MSFSEISQHETEVAGFIAKTFEILNNEEFSKTIFWGSSGRDFVIKDINKFEEIVLPRFFRHQKINSFIRQLNMYGFHKSRKDNSKSIFSHSNFLKGREDLLPTIKRKIKLNEQRLETPMKKKQEDKNDIELITASKEPETAKIMSNDQYQINLRSFLGSREQIHSRFNFNCSLHKLSLNDFQNMEYMENADDKLSIEDDIEAKQEDFGGLGKMVNPSMFFNSFIEKNNQ